MNFKHSSDFTSLRLHHANLGDDRESLVIGVFLCVVDVERQYTYDLFLYSYIRIRLVKLGTIGKENVKLKNCITTYIQATPSLAMKSN